MLSHGISIIGCYVCHPKTEKQAPQNQITSDGQPELCFKELYANERPSIKTSIPQSQRFTTKPIKRESRVNLRNSGRNYHMNNAPVPRTRVWTWVIGRTGIRECMYQHKFPNPACPIAQCSQRGSPSVLKEDRGGRRRVVPSSLFSNLPYHPPPRTRGPAVPRGKCLILAVPTITYSPRQSPTVPLLSLVLESSGLTRFFPTIIYILSFYAFVLYLLPCFWCSSLSLSVLYYNSVRTDRTGGRNAT